MPTSSNLRNLRNLRIALESAVITHGLPRPLNLQVARECEAGVRETGAEPATIAVLDGVIRVGLTSEELQRLANDQQARKCAARDLGALVAAGWSGGTTVSATLVIAAQAGIAIMSTGGIGGVHGGGASDVSADLHQLTRSPVTVVCCGAKAILDLPRTVEYLDTLGVPVLGFGTDEFPGFYVRETGLRLAHRFDTPEELAPAITAYRRAGYPGGILAVQPPPESLTPGDLQKALEPALDRAARQGISGAAVTPFLLAALAEATSGRTLEINRRLLSANARLAAEIGKAMQLV
jgi:pseudouridine-5'-phosphate glycosidase